jgi:hypothetical protein
MAITQRRYPIKELAQRGDAIFEREISPRLGPGDDGKFVAIDIETGDYEVDAKELAASLRLRDRIPDVQIWLRRVGSRYPHRFGSLAR